LLQVIVFRRRKFSFLEGGFDRSGVPPPPPFLGYGIHWDFEVELGISPFNLYIPVYGYKKRKEFPVSVSSFQKDQRGNKRTKETASALVLPVFRDELFSIA
jgi:hypothetical protein